MVLKYNTDAGLLSIIFIVKNTVVPAVSKSRDFKLFLLVHLLVFLSYRFGWLPPHEGAKSPLGLDIQFVRVLTAITTFFVVFYSNTCYTRYQRMYDLTQAVFIDASCYAYALRTALQAKQPKHMRLSTRYVMVAIWLHFQHIRGKTSADELQKLVSPGQSQGLLRPKEAQCLLRIDSNMWGLIVLGWSNEVAAQGFTKANEPKGALGKLLGQATSMNAGMQTISDILALPVPYQYYHLLCKTVSFNILLLAYSMGTTYSWFAPVSFVMCSFVFLGLMSLASALSDPFGDDDVDFPMERWFSEFAGFLISVSEKRYLDGERKVDDMAGPMRYAPRLDGSLVLLSERCSSPDALQRAQTQIVPDTPASGGTPQNPFTRPQARRLSQGQGA